MKKVKLTRAQLRGLILKEFKILTEWAAGGSNPEARHPDDIMKILSDALGTEYVFSYAEEENYELGRITCKYKDSSDPRIAGTDGGVVFTIDFAP